jgi:transposase-like protein
MKCPKCGRYMDLEEKDKSSGPDMRTYYCESCKVRIDVDNGIAFWKVLCDARKEE